MVSEQSMGVQRQQQSKIWKCDWMTDLRTHRGRCSRCYPIWKKCAGGEKEDCEQEAGGGGGRGASAPNLSPTAAPPSGAPAHSLLHLHTLKISYAAPKFHMLRLHTLPDWCSSCILCICFFSKYQMLRCCPSTYQNRHFLLVLVFGLLALILINVLVFVLVISRDIKKIHGDPLVAQLLDFPEIVILA